MWLDISIFKPFKCIGKLHWKYIDYLVSEYQKTENELENYDVYQLFDQGLFLCYEICQPVL